MSRQTPAFSQVIDNLKAGKSLTSSKVSLRDLSAIANFKPDGVYGTNEAGSVVNVVVELFCKGIGDDQVLDTETQVLALSVLGTATLGFLSLQEDPMVIWNLPKSSDQNIALMVEYASFFIKLRRLARGNDKILAWLRSSDGPLEIVRFTFNLGRHSGSGLSAIRESDLCSLVDCTGLICTDIVNEKYSSLDCNDLLNLGHLILVEGIVKSDDAVASFCSMLATLVLKWNVLARIGDSEPGKGESMIKSCLNYFLSEMDDAASHREPEAPLVVKRRLVSTTALLCNWSLKSQSVASCLVHGNIDRALLKCLQVKTGTSQMENFQKFCIGLLQNLTRRQISFQKQLLKLKVVGVINDLLKTSVADPVIVRLLLAACVNLGATLEGRTELLSSKPLVLSFLDESKSSIARDPEVAELSLAVIWAISSKNAYAGEDEVTDVCNMMCRSMALHRNEIGVLATGLGAMIFMLNLYPVFPHALRKHHQFLKSLRAIENRSIRADLDIIDQLLEKQA